MVRYQKAWMELEGCSLRVGDQKGQASDLAGRGFQQAFLTFL